MARPAGIFRFIGSLDELSSYNSVYGEIIRRKGGASKEKIKTDPAFVRVREHNKEFGECAKASQTLRNALWSLLPTQKDHSLAGRITSLMWKIKNEDKISVPGERTPGKGMMTAGGRALMKGFEVHEKGRLRDILITKYDLNISTGEINFQNFNAAEALDMPKAASHVQLQSGWIKIDIDGKKFETQMSASVTLPITSTVANVILLPPAPQLPGQSLLVLKIVFVQIINGALFRLKDSKYNSVTIVDIV